MCCGDNDVALGVCAYAKILKSTTAFLGFLRLRPEKPDGGGEVFHKMVGNKKGIIAH